MDMWSNKSNLFRVRSICGDSKRYRWTGFGVTNLMVCVSFTNSRGPWNYNPAESYVALLLLCL